MISVWPRHEQSWVGTLMLATPALCHKSWIQVLYSTRMTWAPVVKYWCWSSISDASTYGTWLRKGIVTTPTATGRQATKSRKERPSGWKAAT